MHDDRDIVEARIRRAVHEWIGPAARGERLPLQVSAWDVPGEPVPVAEALAASYRPFDVGTPWGPPWSTTWFRLEGEVPAGWAGEPVDAVVDLGFDPIAGPGFQAEGLVWVADGSGGRVPWRGLHPLNHALPVTAEAVGGETVDWLVEAAANPQIGPAMPDANGDPATASRQPRYVLRRAELVVVRPEVAALRDDIRTLTRLMRRLPLTDPRRHEILRALERMLDALVLEDVAGTAAAGRAELADVLARPAVPSAHRISAVGHAHIDSAWLWPVRETVRKCARSFSNVLDLMDRYPELVFACSQAAQYQWMLDRYPTVFDGIAKRVADGRWVPVGGMWVEADVNLAGGEALVRQFTHGQRFFREHFDVTCTEMWLPDVFGYSGSLPQIMRLAGIDRFLTQKLSWNKTNAFPHHSFLWEGIDGSTVFTHFPPVDTYNATFHVDEQLHAVENFKDKGGAHRSLLPFGWGDGGGGPTADMLEQYRRVRDLEGLPRVEIESPQDFFDQAIADYPDAPRWVGELYFETHRGTYTSQAATKAGNRRCELLLREAELWWTAATAGGADYPAADLDRLWKAVLLHQFHDILPGSSIAWVHDEAAATYADVATELEGLVAGALARLQAGGPVLANPAPHPWSGVVVLDPAAGPVDAGAARPAGFAPGGDGPVQELADGSLTFAATVPALGVAPAVAEAPGDSVAVTPRSLENDCLRVELDDHGLVVSMLDKATGRQILAEGARANLLQLHPDHPNEYDAWDLDDFYRHRVTDLVEVDAIEVVDDGPLVGRLRVTRRHGDSTFVQTLELRAASPRLDVHCDIDWKQRQEVLKVAFPVDVHATEATREIQFGHLATAIHTNTSWDQARFEVCAHRWVDVAEPGYGVALLNADKYGYDITRTRTPSDRPSTTVRLTLLRAPIFPDPDTDRGRHRFTYALLPHRGPLQEAGVVAHGYWLNTPVRAVAGGAAGSTGSAVDDGLSVPVVTSTDPAVVVEAVKRADDGSGDLVLRCYESWGGRADTVLHLAQAPSSVEVTDLHEHVVDGLPEVPVAVDGALVHLTLRPFQLATLRLRP